jgi:hypothetical protein
LVDINKKLENLPILGLATFGINATGARSPAVDRGSYLFLFILKLNFCCVPEAAYQDSKQLFVSGDTAYL